MTEIPGFDGRYLATRDGEYINTFRDKHDASKATGAMPNNIKACCNGKRKSAGGFIWKY